MKRDETIREQIMNQGALNHMRNNTRIFRPAMASYDCCNHVWL